MKKDFFRDNRKKIVDQMEDNAMLVLFAGTAPQKTADEFYTFTPNRHFYYLTGIDKPKIIFLITKIKGESKETLFIEKADPVMEKWVGKTITDEACKEISGVQNIGYLDAFKTAFNDLLDANDIQMLYLNLEKLEWDIAQTEAHLFAREVSEKYPFLKMNNIYHKVNHLRAIKTEDELENIRKAIAITDKGIKNMLANAQPGMKEYELEAYFDFSLKASGVTDHAFHAIVASGANGAVLHYNANHSEVKDGSLVLIDLGAQFDYYNADISRTFPVNGHFTERQKVLYNIVLKAQLETIKAIKPGVPYKKLNEVTKGVLIEECKKIGLITEDSELSKYYYHGVTHYLGLDTHDVGSREAVLEAGMLLTVEPGLYIAEENIGIRIEDNVVVTENGCVNLSADIIKTVEDIEAYMQHK